jgi:hypothetical protein
MKVELFFNLSVDLKVPKVPQQLEVLPSTKIPQRGENALLPSHNFPHFSLVAEKLSHSVSVKFCSSEKTAIKFSSFQS